MKKIGKLLFCFVALFSFSLFVDAACKNEELNEWATKVEPKFIEVKELGLNSSEYAYLLTISPLRNDITLKAIDGSGGKATGKMLQPSKTEDNIQAIGCYTNLEEETYTIEVYGAKNSACPNELLKTMKYTVPRFNRYLKDERCANSDSELCKTFTNATKDMSQAEFNQAMRQESGETEDNGTFSKIWNVILDYGLYIIIPLLIVCIIYAIRINKFKKEERDR